MKPKSTQIARIKAKLNRDGYIGRNECLKNFISRLGAYIIVLRKQGYEFRTEDTGKDYIYHWVNRTKTIIVEKEDGSRIATQVLIK